jgi:CRISPR-associated protein Csh2
MVEIMKTKKINRVYGVIGIKSIMANWNADFTGRPKTISDGAIYGSDKALKYPMKRMWDADGKKVLYLKSYKYNDEKKKGDSAKTIQPNSLPERFSLLFGGKQDKAVDSKELIFDLFECLDVENFGATYAAGQNISITGAVQISQGFNKYSDTSVEVQNILSPFRDSTKDGASASTLGTKVVSDEAHYFYGFSVNPTNYNDYTKIDDRIFYSEEAYSSFKEAAIKSATFYNTNSKFGCENEFALFIELKEGKKLFLPELSQYIEFTKEDEKNVINLKGMSFLNDLTNDIEKIEIFYNPITTQVLEDFLITAKIKTNIITGKDI